MVRAPGWNVVALVLLGGLLAGAPAAAATPEVKDEAGFFSAAAVKKADEILKQIEKRHHKEVVIETYKTARNGKAEEVKAMSTQARDQFFADWLRDRAKATSDNGIFILICRDPGHIQIGMGAKTRERAFTPADRDRLRERLVTRFKDKEYDQGLLEAVESIDQTLAGHQASSPPASRTNAARPTATTTASGSSGLMGLLCVGVVIVLGVWLVIGLIRSFTGGGMGGGMGGGGGFFPGLMGGLFGAMAGAWLYDTFFHSGTSQAFGGESNPGGGGVDTGDDFTSSGGDIGGDTDFGGGDFGDFGGGDFGGGGGDF